MVTVRVSETYDLSTQTDKMGLIGIHTPSQGAVHALYHGLMANHRYARLIGCDVTIACASMLPADPQQIGVESGDIAPQDMFNPILYKAVSNESFNTLIQRIVTTAQDISTGGGYVFGSVAKTDIEPPDGSGWTDWDVYYGLLAEPDGWRKAMPQQGLEMRGLYPMVFPVLANSPGFSEYADATPPYNASIGPTGVLSSYENANVMRGPAIKMPRIPIHGPATGVGQVPMWFPTTYVGAIITPPAKLNKLYYRMKVTWTIEFSDVCPVQEYEKFDQWVPVSRRTYASDYDQQSKVMTSTNETVDARNAELDHVMTSAK